MGTDRGTLISKGGEKEKRREDVGRPGDLKCVIHKLKIEVMYFCRACIVIKTQRAQKSNGGGRRINKGGKKNPCNKGKRGIEGTVRMGSITTQCQK